MKAFTFDLWGTLIIEPSGRARIYKQNRLDFMKEYLHEAGAEFTPEAFRKAFDISAEEIARVRQGGHDLDTLDQTRILLRNLALEPEEELVCGLERGLAETIFEHPPALACHAGEVLPFLAQRAKIGLISNTGWTPGRVLRRLLEGYGILSYFTHLTFSNEVRLWKPNPQIFLHTTKALGVHPEDAMHVGDLLNVDIRGAKGVGMKTAYLGKSEEADFSLEDLGDLMAIWEKVK